MGIRYYAYAFESDQTQAALADPMRFISEDPLADAWGMEPGFTVGAGPFEQSVPKRDMLYLDKAWGHLQRLTGGGTTRVEQPRAAYRMFEGGASFTGRGYVPWSRGIAPGEVVLIARDLETMSDAAVERSVDQMIGSGFGRDGDQDYVLEYFRAARNFAVGVAQEGRGFAYTIG